MKRKKIIVLIPSSSGLFFKYTLDSIQGDIQGLNPFFIRSFLQIW